MGVEKEIQVGVMKKRFDLLIFDRTHQPWMLIECKSEQVSLKIETAEQLLRYHQVLRARYLVITNGHTAMGWHNDQHQILLMNEWPVWG
ncbi:MAG: type I restriction enzyme HsdR N-terminal domain-containing protein, partial [Bacteroidota bacterium]